MKFQTVYRGFIAAVLAVFAILAGGGVNTAFADHHRSGEVCIGLTCDAGSQLGVAVGNNADATAINSVAVGSSSTATGTGGVAVGTSTDATGLSAVAIGSGADATGANAIAIGGARTGGRQVVASDNEIRIGDDMHTQVDIGGVRLKGDGGGATSVVTRLAGLETMLGMPTAGDPAPTSGVAFRTDIDSLRREFGERDDELAAGVALASSYETPFLLPGERYGLGLGAGHFDGESALSISGIARLPGAAGGAAMFISGGVGVAKSQIGGRVGVQFKWK